MPKAKRPPKGGKENRAPDARSRVEKASERFLPLIHRAARRANIGTDQQQAAHALLVQASAKRLLRGRPANAMAVASLYGAARATGQPIPLSRLATLTGCRRMQLGRAYRVLASGLRLNLLPAQPEDHLGEFCKQLGVSNSVRRRAAELLIEARRNGFSPARSPPGLAAAALYLVAPLLGESLTEREVADAAQISEVTVRNAARDLKNASRWTFPGRRRPAFRSKHALVPTQEHPIGRAARSNAVTGG